MRRPCGATPPALLLLLLLLPLLAAVAVQAAVEAAVPETRRNLPDVAHADVLGLSLETQAPLQRRLQAALCPDFDDSGQVGVPDLLLLLGAFGGTTATPGLAQFDLDDSGRIAVPDLLLLLGVFGVPCSRAPAIPTAATWFDLNTEPTPIATWGKGVDWCFLQGLELCKYDSYCPNGDGAPPTDGTKAGDEWAPIADQPNRWVQVGTWSGDVSHTCMTHDEVAGGIHGDPGWGVDPVSHGFMGWLMCCPVGELAGTCLNMPNSAVEVSFLSDSADTSGNNRVVTHTGGNAAEIGPTGAHFDGNGDYLTIEAFEYETDATFTVSFWFTKEGCTGGIYEYLFSDHFSVGTTMWDRPYLDIYIGCETSGGGWSTLPGTETDGFCTERQDVVLEMMDFVLK